MVNFVELEGEVFAATVAQPLLLPVEDVLILAVGYWSVYVSPAGYVRPGRDIAVVEEAAHCLLEAHANQFNGLGGDVDTDPTTAQLVGSDTGRSAPAERVEDGIAFVAAGLDEALK